MIIIYHNGSDVISVTSSGSAAGPRYNSTKLSDAVFELAKDHPEELIVWCHADLQASLNLDAIPQLFTTRKTLASFGGENGTYLPEAIGYVEESSFIKVNTLVRFPTWRMSSLVGAMHASVINLDEVNKLKSSQFDYFLNSLARLAMPLGLRCFSAPQFLTSETSIKLKQETTAELFKFVGQHYKKVWVLLLLLDMMLYENRYPVFQALASLFCSRRTIVKNTFDQIGDANLQQIDLKKTVDVVIPTIGREKYLFDVLTDLAAQTLVPQKVIIIEQNPELGSATKLDYLYDRQWPFQISHQLIHQIGVCNARNLALREIESDWVFLADDDIRFESGFLDRILSQIYAGNNEVFNICCLHKGQRSESNHIHQTTIFGSGCSIVSRRSISELNFNMAYEFGFGEDSDFGCQLMNKGFSIEYLPEPVITHLKAPVGGFRIKPTHEWSFDEIQPKPSPTVMLFKMSNHTKEQLAGYKTMLFIKFYREQAIRNPFKYISTMNRRWNRSKYWALWLKNNQSS